MKDSVIHFETSINKGKNKEICSLISALYLKIIYVPTVPYFARSSGWVRIPVALGVTPSPQKQL